MSCPRGRGLGQRKILSYFFSCCLIILNHLRLFFFCFFLSKEKKNLLIKFENPERGPSLRLASAHVTAAYYKLYLVMPWRFTTPRIAWLTVTFHANEAVIKINHTISTESITVLRFFALNGHFYVTSANFLKRICPPPSSLLSPFFLFFFI